MAEHQIFAIQDVLEKVQLLEEPKNLDPGLRLKFDSCKAYLELGPRRMSQKLKKLSLKYPINKE